MPNDETPRERYRRLARECLAVAKTMPEGKDRTMVLEMAAVWHRLANEYAGPQCCCLSRHKANSLPCSSNRSFSRRTTRRIERSCPWDRHAHPKTWQGPESRIEPTARC